jgi:hypothetical protein
MDPVLIDTTVDVDDAKELRRRKMISPVPSIVHIIHPHQKGLLPARLRIDNKVQSLRQYPLKIEEVSIDNVLDLRQLESTVAKAPVLGLGTHSARLVEADHRTEEVRPPHRHPAATPHRA